MLPPKDSPIRFDRDPLDACISGSQKFLLTLKKEKCFTGFIEEQVGKYNKQLSL